MSDPICMAVKLRKSTTSGGVRMIIAAKTPNTMEFDFPTSWSILNALEHYVVDARCFEVAQRKLIRDIDGWLVSRVVGLRPRPAGPM
jgi:hypothetical protein